MYFTGACTCTCTCMHEITIKLVRPLKDLHDNSNTDMLRKKDKATQQQSNSPKAAHFSKKNELPWVGFEPTLYTVPTQGNTQLECHSGVARGGARGAIAPPFFKNNVIRTFVIDVR